MSAILLKVHDLTMRFGGVTALNKLNLAVRKDEVLGLIGPNGSGKTTFFNVVTGIYSPSAGLVDFDGRETTRYTAQEVCRAGITRTFQRSRLCLPLTVFDNIVIGNYQNLDHRLFFNLFRRDALKRQYQKNLDEAQRLLATFNDQLVDRLFDPVSALTMIDRRRIEICRALISRPRLLLLDEPSAGMTHDETHELMTDLLLVRERLREAGNSVTIIIIEHEMNVIDRVTDRCIVLNYGEKIAEGTYAQIAADPEVQRAYLGSD